MIEAEVATRDSFPIDATSCEWDVVDLMPSFDGRDFDWVRRGFIPKAKDETWFIFFEEGWLYLHRARSGACFARLKFEEREGRQVSTTAWFRKGARLGYQATWNRSDKIRAQETRTQLVRQHRPHFASLTAGNTSCVPVSLV
jgi:hypothetical protein